MNIAHVRIYPDTFRESQTLANISLVPFYTRNRVYGVNVIENARTNE